MQAGVRNPVLNALIHGHLWLALGAAAQTWFMQDLLDLQGWRAPVLAFLGTIVAYTFMRWARTGPAAHDLAPSLVWFSAHRRTLLAFAWLCAAVLFALAWPVALSLTASLWPAAVVVLLYALPLPWVGGRTLGLRRVPFLKAFLIAGCWAFVTVALPLAVNEVEQRSGGAAWLFGMQVAFFLSLAIAFDLRDHQVDPRSLRTIPQVLRPPVAKTLSILLMAYPAVVFLILAYIGRVMQAMEGETGLPWPFLGAASGYLVAIGVVARSGPQRGPLHYGLLLDGLLLLVPLLYAVGRWV